MFKYLFDNNLSLNEKGLLATLLNLPKEFKITIKNLYALSIDSKYRVKKTLQDLKKKGYLKVEQINPAGREFQYKYEAYISPNTINN